jgi:hypothetical protein
MSQKHLLHIAAKSCALHGWDDLKKSLAAASLLLYSSAGGTSAVLGFLNNL